MSVNMVDIEMEELLSGIFGINCNEELASNIGSISGVRCMWPESTNKDYYYLVVDPIDMSDAVIESIKELANASDNPE